MGNARAARQSGVKGFGEIAEKGNAVISRDTQSLEYPVRLPAHSEVNGLRVVTRHAPAKSAISKKLRDRLISLGYIEQRIGRLLPTAKGILYFARHRREHLRISDLIRSH